MATIKFGTDGVRGRAFDDLTLVDSFLIGRAAAEVLGGSEAVIGRDPRESGEAILAAVAAGLRSGGVSPMSLGVAPTPAVAAVCGRRNCIGVMVSASHNPWYDNGIKLFSAGGSKLSDDEQDGVEQRLSELDSEMTLPVTEQVPSIQPQIGEWVDAIKASIDVPLDGLGVVLDCANGAASHVVAPALIDLGADVTVLFNTPDGRNINDGCGSTHPEVLAAAVVERQADLGLALDGDADRLLAVDHQGRVVDGDHLMAMLAIDMNERGVLAGAQLVVTVMSNLGLLRAMETAGIAVEVTPVGDRNVLIAIDELGANFGGEQSGHLIFGDHGGTGDGFLSGVQLLALLKRSGRTLADLAETAMTSFPQVLQNVPVDEKMPDIADRIRADIERLSEVLGDEGRVLVRASGTEPLVRVMVEAATENVAQAVCDELCAAVEAL